MSTPDDADTIFEAWRRDADRGGQPDPESVIRANPDLAGELRLRFDAVRLLDGEFAEGRTHRPPERVGAYRIVRELGRGGMGVVYEAVQESMDRTVALKVLFPSVAPAGHAVRRFRQEARIAGSLKHTNIVAVHDLGQESGLWFCAMELVDGPPLSRVIEQVVSHAGGVQGGRPDSGTPSTLTGEASGGSSHFRRVARMFAEVADALGVAHEAGVLHRDVKPSNLLLDRAGHLRLVDFGLARLEVDRAHLTRTGDVVGTPLYMSPEHFRGRDVGPRSDVYSLGATLYEVLTLRPPHDPNDATLLASEVVTKDPPRPRSVDPTVPRDLETVVLKALEKDPARRYATADAFAADLRAFAAGDAIRAKRAGPIARGIRLVKRHPARAVAISVALIGAVAVAGFASRAGVEGDARRDAEYRLLLRRAVDFRPWDGNEGASQAQPLYEQAIALDADRSDAYLARALAGGPPLGDRLLDVDSAAVRGVPPETASLLRAFLFSVYRREPEATEALRAAGGSATADEPLAHLVAGRRAWREGELEQAEREYDAALRGLPADSILVHVLRTHLTDIHLETGQHAKALNEVHALQALGDDRVKTAALEAWLWRRLGKESEASERATALIDRVVGDENESIVVGGWWEGTRANDWLGRLTERAIERFKESPALWGLSATAHGRRYRWDLALYAWDQCLRLKPGVAWVQAERAEALAHLHRHAEALTASEDAVALAPGDVRVQVSRARVCLFAGRTDLGERAAREALRLDPDCVPASVLIAGRCLLTNRLEEAERLLTEVLRKHRGNRMATFGLCELRFQQSRWKEGLAAIDAALLSDPEDAAAHTLRARTLEKLGLAPEAEKAYRRSLELCPNGVDALDGLGRLLVGAGRPDEAVRAFRTLLELHPRNGYAWNELGAALRAQGKSSDALEAYREAQSIEPENLYYIGNVAGILVDMGKAEEALPFFDRVVKGHPDDAIDRYNRGLAYRALGRMKEALTDFADSARLDPTDPDPRWAAGTLLFSTGKVEDAVVEMEAAASLAPENAALPHNLAFMLLRAKRLAPAEAAARRAIVLAPQDAGSQWLLGHILLQRNDPQSAVPFLEAACKLAPDVARHAQDCASCYFEQGREGAAVDVLTDAVHRFPDDASIRLALAWSLLAAEDPAVRDSDKAAIHARRASEIDATKSPHWAVLGGALYRQNRLGEAIARLEQAGRCADAASAEPNTSYFLAMALWRSARAEEARVAFERAEALRLKGDPKDAVNLRMAAEAAEVLETPLPK